MFPSVDARFGAEEDDGDVTLTSASVLTRGSRLAVTVRNKRGRDFPGSLRGWLGWLRGLAQLGAGLGWPSIFFLTKALFFF